MNPEASSEGGSRMNPEASSEGGSRMNQVEKPIGVAVLGLGNVGREVVRIIEESATDLAARIGAPLVLRGVAVRELSGDRGVPVELLTDNPEELAARDDVDIVVELMGPVEPARKAILAALEHGKSVVTANKALLAQSTGELSQAAERAQVDLYFEASVAGAIPVIRPLTQSLAGDTVLRVAGIVNGTTNYILSEMASTGADYASALADASALGYAEADPTADVEGYDAAAKAAILASIAFHTPVTADDVYREGITKVGSADFEAAAARAVVDESSPVVKVVNQIIVQGVRKRASDIHIEALEHAVRVRYRIDGALTEAIQLPAKMSSPIASRIKVLADLNIVERRRPQDGQFSTEVDGRPIDIRTSVVNTIHGEKVVLRLLDKTRSLIGLEQLGMPDDLVQRYLSVVDVPVGMFLCTGPTGSGKTTSLYATLTEIQDDTRNVVTIEDPVEYEFAGINQMQVHEAGGFTFADGLRGTLRQDPDVILVGEIRDAETARIAMQAALTGHLVLSSLHAVDAVSALHRFVDMGMEPFLVASAINGIMGQRLLRRICDSCKEPATPNPAQAHMVGRVLKERIVRLAREATDTACYGATETASGSGVFEFPAVPVPLPGVDDDGLGAADGAGSAEVIVRCQAVSASSISPESREIFLQAALTTSGGGWNDNPIGLARVKYLDKDGPREAPGMEMIVCDWRLGRFDAGFGGLSQCP